MRSHVVRFNVYLANPAVNQALVFGNPRVVQVDANFNDIVDAFGQYTRAEYLGKVHSQAELGAQESGEQIDLALHPGPSQPGLYHRR